MIHARTFANCLKVTLSFSLCYLPQYSIAATQVVPTSTTTSAATATTAATSSSSATSTIATSSTPTGGAVPLIPADPNATYQSAFGGAPLSWADIKTKCGFTPTTPSLSQNTWIVYMSPDLVGMAPTDLNPQSSPGLICANYVALNARANQGQRSNGGGPGDQTSAMYNAQLLLDTLYTNGPQLAAYLNAGDYVGAFNFAVQKKIMIMLEEPIGFRVMGIKPFTQSQMTAFYAAAAQHWTTAQLGCNPADISCLGNILWGDASGLPGDAITNFNTAGDNSWPDLARFAGMTPNISLMDRWVMPILQTVMMAVFTAGFGAALGAGAVAATAGTEGVVTASSGALAADGSALVTATSTSSFLGTTLSVTEAGVTTSITTLSTAGVAVTGAVAGTAMAAMNGENVGAAAAGGVLSSLLGISGATDALNGGIGSGLNVPTGVASTIGGLVTGTATGSLLNGGNVTSALIGSIESTGASAGGGLLVTGASALGGLGTSILSSGPSSAGGVDLSSDSTPVNTSAASPGYVLPSQAELLAIGSNTFAAENLTPESAAALTGNSGSAVTQIRVATQVIAPDGAASNAGSAAAGTAGSSNAIVLRPTTFAVDGLSPNVTVYTNLPTSNALSASSLNDWLLGNNLPALSGITGPAQSLGSSWEFLGPQSNSLLGAYQEASAWQNPSLDFNVGSPSATSYSLNYGTDGAVSKAGNFSLPDGFVSISVHGDPTGLAANVNGNWVEISPQTIASDLSSLGVSGQCILLTACNGIYTAQSLAEATGMPVVSANGFVHSYNNIPVISTVDNTSTAGLVFNNQRYVINPSGSWSVSTPTNLPTFYQGQSELTSALQFGTDTSNLFSVNTASLQTLNSTYAPAGGQTSTISLMQTSDGTNLVGKNLTVGEEGATAIANATNFLAKTNPFVLPVSQSGTTLYQPVASGISYADLSPSAVANANAQVQQFSQNITSQYGTYVNTPNGGRVIFDTNPNNFTFDANGNIVSNFDPFYYDPTGHLTSANVVPQWRTPGANSGSSTETVLVPSTATSGATLTRTPSSAVAVGDAAPGTTLVMNIGSKGLGLVTGAAQSGGEILLLDVASTTGTTIGGTIQQNFPTVTSPIDGLVTDAANGIVNLQSAYYNCPNCRAVGGIVNTVVQNDVAAVSGIGSTISSACSSSSTCSSAVSWGTGLANDYQSWKTNTLIPTVQSTTQTTINVVTGIYNFVTGNPVSVNVGGITIGFNGSGKKN